MTIYIFVWYECVLGVYGDHGVYILKYSMYSIGEGTIPKPVVDNSVEGIFKVFAVV